MRHVLTYVKWGCFMLSSISNPRDGLDVFFWDATGWKLIFKLSFLCAHLDLVKSTMFIRFNSSLSVEPKARVANRGYQSLHSNQNFLFNQGPDSHTANPHSNCQVQLSVRISLFLYQDDNIICFLDQFQLSESRYVSQAFLSYSSLCFVLRRFFASNCGITCLVDRFSWSLKKSEMVALKGEDFHMIALSDQMETDLNNCISSSAMAISCNITGWSS